MEIEEIPENANENCPGPKSKDAGKSSSCDGCPNQKICSSGEEVKEDPAVEQIKKKLSNVKNIVLVLSGKGGVGKSTVSSQLAMTLATDKNLEVGLLDIDICGPSIPRMMGLESEEVHQSNDGWSPIYHSDNLGVMSIGFLLNNKNDPVIWRGPRKNGLIKQFLLDVIWDDLDYLIIDTPPGTSDEHLSVLNYLSKANVLGSVIVTTPQEVSLLDVRKEINFCIKTDLKVIGVVENMSVFTCPHCKCDSEIFLAETGGAEKMCEEFKIDLLSKIPLDIELLKSVEKGKCYVDSFPEKPTSKSFLKIVEKVKSFKKN